MRVPPGKKVAVKKAALRGGKEVSAMGWVEDAHGGVLMVKQLRGRKLWTLPGGKIGAMESVEAGLKREILEETSAHVIFASQMALFDRPAKRNITFLFRVTLKPDDVLKPRPREIAAVEYHAELPRDTSPSLRHFWKLMRH
ncbi:MAG TPA: NUDIX hydrolase [Chthoniobacterales bacterium]|jgi:ADP-ribose pyrophosphatase YjhB (NUDIX family)